MFAYVPSCHFLPWVLGPLTLTSKRSQIQTVLAPCVCILGVAFLLLSALWRHFQKSPLTSPRGRQFSDDVDDDDDYAYLRRLHKRTGFKSTDSFDDVTPDYVSGDFRGLLQRSAAPTRDMSSAAITNDVTAEQIDFRSETLTRRVKTKDCSSAHVQAEGEQLDFRSALTRQVDTDDKSSACVTSD